MELGLFRRQIAADRLGDGEQIIDALPQKRPAQVQRQEGLLEVGAEGIRAAGGRRAWRRLAVSAQVQGQDAMAGLYQPLDGAARYRVRRLAVAVDVEDDAPLCCVLLPRPKPKRRHAD